MQTPATVNEPATTPTIDLPSPGTPVTWEDLAKLFNFLHEMWEGDPANRRHLKTVTWACNEKADLEPAAPAE